MEVSILYQNWGMNAVGNKRYYFYVRHKLLQDILDELQKTRQLSDVVEKALLNGLEKEIAVLAQEAERRAVELRKIEKLYKNFDKLKEEEQNELFEHYKQYRQQAGFDHKKALGWLDHRAKKIGHDPEVLLNKFEKQIKDEGK